MRAYAKEHPEEFDGGGYQYTSTGSRQGPTQRGTKAVGRAAVIVPGAKPVVVRPQAWAPLRVAVGRISCRALQAYVDKHGNSRGPLPLTPRARLQCPAASAGVPNPLPLHPHPYPTPPSSRAWLQLLACPGTLHCLSCRAPFSHRLPPLHPHFSNSRPPPLTTTATTTTCSSLSTPSHLPVHVPPEPGCNFREMAEPLKVVLACSWTYNFPRGCGGRREGGNSRAGTGLA